MVLHRQPTLAQLKLQLKAQRWPNFHLLSVIYIADIYLLFKVQGQKLWYDVKGHVTRNTHVKYENPVSHGS